MSAVDNDHAVRVDDLFHVVSDQEYCDPLLPVQLMDRLDDLTPAVRVQHRCRLVQNNTPGLHRHHSGDRHSLFLSAGKLIRGLKPVRCHSDCLQALIDSRPDLVGRNAHVLRAESNVLLDDVSDDLVIRVLEYHSRCLSDIPEMFLIVRLHIGNIYGSVCWKQDSVHQFREGRFTGPVMSQDRHKISFFDVQRDAF